MLFEGAVAGFTEYRRSGERITFIHTEVAEEFAGRGLAGTLAAAALDDVRERGLAVVPLCPYIRGFIRQHQQYSDLVPAEHRTDLAM